MWIKNHVSFEAPCKLYLKSMCLHYIVFDQLRWSINMCILLNVTFSRFYLCIHTFMYNQMFMECNFLFLKSTWHSMYYFSNPLKFRPEREGYLKGGILKVAYRKGGILNVACRKGGILKVAYCQWIKKNCFIRMPWASSKMRTKIVP
jgi:hypothetical protein